MAAPTAFTVTLAAANDDIASWLSAPTTTPEVIAATFLLGWQVSTTGLAAYYHKHAHDAEIASLKAELADTEAAFEDRVAKRVKNEVQLVKDECAFAYKQLARAREEFEATVGDRVASQVAVSTAELQSQLAIQRRLVEMLEQETQKAASRLEADVSHYKAKWEEASQAAARTAREAFEGVQAEEVARLKAENQALRGCNTVKGRIGEALLQEVIGATLTDWEVTNKGKTAHESDIHLTSAAGDLIIVESKNKDAIAKTDVDKFLVDIAYMDQTQRPCIGAVFVSIRTPNIPHKGHACLELMNKRPVLWVGFRGEEEVAAQLPLYMRVFVQYCQVAKATAADVDTEGVFVAVNEMFKTAQGLKTQVARLQRQHLDTTKTIAEIEKTIQGLFGGMEAFLKKHGALAAATATAMTGSGTGVDSEQNKGYVCRVCSERFTVKKKYEAHGKRCMGDISDRLEAPPPATGLPHSPLLVGP